MKKEVSVASLLMQRAIGCDAGQMMKVAETKAACWDVEERRCDLPTTTRSTFLMAFSHDGTKIASAHGDHKIYVSDVRSGKCLNTLEGHPRTPWCLAFHPSFGDILASGCLGGEVRVWDLHGGCEVWTEERKMTIASLAFHPTDRVLVVAANDEIHFWDWSRPKPFARCKTASERERVKLVRFDRCGHGLYTGVANAPREEAPTRRRPQHQQQPQQQRQQREEECVVLQRYLSTLREQHQQLLLCLQELRDSNTPAASPRAAERAPRSPTSSEALRRAREYAAEVTARERNADVLEELGQVFQPRSYDPNLFSRPREFLLELQSLQRWYARECQRIRELLIARSWTQVREGGAGSSSSRASGEDATEADQARSSPGGAAGYEPQAVLQTRLSIQHIRNARNIMATILLLNRIQDAFRAQAISRISRVLERELAGLIDHICAMLCELASRGDGSLGFLRRVALRLVHACRRRLANLPRTRGESSDYDEPPSSPGPSRLLDPDAPGPSSYSSSSSSSNSTLYGSTDGGDRDRSAFQTFRHSDRRPDPDRVTEPSHPEDVTESLIRTDHMLRMIVDDLQGLLRYIGGGGGPPPPPYPRPFGGGGGDSGSQSDDENRDGRPRLQDQMFWDRLRNIRSRSEFFTGMGPSSEHCTLNRTTYRLQRWDFSKCEIPDVSDGSVNVVVRECLIQNDACVDISSDGRLLATFLPGRVSTLTLLGIHSLEPDTMGQCLYLWNFRSNVISVSLSPLANYVLVGMGSTRRLMLERDGKLIIGDILQLVSGDDEREDYLQQIRTVAVNVDERADCSLNSTRWLPVPGQGFVYGTNRGQLNVCRPRGPAEGHGDPVWFAEGESTASAFWAPRRTYREIMESVYAPRAPLDPQPQQQQQPPPPLPPVPTVARALFQETQSRGTQTEPEGRSTLGPSNSRDSI